MARIRRFVQIAFLVFFAVLFLRARFPYQGYPASDLLLRISPLAPVFYFIDNLHLPLFFWPAIIILLLTPALGRFFCGWICPLGTSLDLFSRCIKSPTNKTSAKFQKFRWVKYGILSATLVLALFSLNLWSYFDPLAIFTRITTVLFYPLLTLGMDNLMLAGAKISALEPVSYPLYDWFKTHIMPENQQYLQAVFSVLFLAVAIFGLEKLSKRFWCRNLCPAGALLGVLSQFRFFERTVGDSCPVCNRCQTECKMNAIPESQVKETLKTECIECYNCGEKCPPDHKSIHFRWRWKPYRSAPDFSRRQFIGTTLTGFATLGLVNLGLTRKEEDHKKIRPPGALPENEFTDRCIRCLACVRICASNGACLQPAGFDTRLEDLWTPVANMREGYCEFNCNLCGEICPTRAILPLGLAEKQKTPMGIAYFDKNLCIPFVRNEDCLVCEEHCPVPDKAIKFDIHPAVLPDGSHRMVKYPYIVRELCIGCGICETKCPLPGAGAVFITRENEKRISESEAGLQV